MTLFDESQKTFIFMVKISGNQKNNENSKSYRMKYLKSLNNNRANLPESN